MFFGANSFNQDISNWCVANIGSEPSNFKTTANASFQGNAAFQPSWGAAMLRKFGSNFF